MHKQLAQGIVEDGRGRFFIEGDWHPNPLPPNIELDEMAYPDSSYSFTTFYSKKPVGFKLGYGSGNYGHGVFTTGENGEINIGNFVVLQCTRIISNLSVTIKDHCMFSWGSVITDSWVGPETELPEVRRTVLRNAANSCNRHLEVLNPLPVVVEENVWVGFEAIILPGVTVGRGAVIGCKAVVSEDVPEYAVVVGNPGRIIKYLAATDTEEQKRAALNLFL
jgi:acetyltransferase-like isoleucine patch superfamily enzyme